MVKQIKWVDFTASQKDDVEFLQQQKSAWENIADYENDRNWKAINKRLDALLYKRQQQHEKDAIRMAKEDARRNSKEAKMEQSAARLEQTIKSIEALENEWYYISSEQKYIKQDKHTGEWLFFPERGLVVQENLFSWKDYDGTTVDPLLDLLERMRANGHIKERLTQSFGEVPENALNTMATDGWLQPREGEVHPLFDILFDSLSAGREDIRENIERTIITACLHPEVKKLPTIMIYGEGGAGKNILADDIMPTIFTPAMCLTATPDDLFGGFNGHLIGKRFVFIDEAKPDSVKPEKLRNFTGGTTITINRKGVSQFSVENCVLWMIGGNEKTGVALLRGDSSDRRFTVVAVHKNIMEWVADKRKLSYDKESGTGEAVDWFFEHEHVFRDKNCVAAWLHSIVEKHKGKSRPFAVKTDDYQDLLQANKTEFAETMETIFNDCSFVGISVNDLYDAYRSIAHGNRFSVKDVKGMGKIKFGIEAKAWLRQHKPHVENRNVNIIAPHSQRSVAVRCWIDPSALPKDLESRAVLFDYRISEKDGVWEMLGRKQPDQHKTVKPYISVVESLKQQYPSR